MRVISKMFGSNRPRVLGFVSIRPAVSGPAAARSASRSTPPRALEGTATTVNPAMAADAGLVPWAESGTRILVRAASPRDWWYRRISKRPVYSPWAPAAGCMVMPAMPVISHSSFSARYSTSKAPWAVPAGCSGCSSAKPGRAASASLTRGLYFMVQEPSG